MSLAFRLPLSAVLVCALSFPAPAAVNADDVKLDRARMQAEQVATSLIRNDLEAFANLTHPRILELMGGRAKLIERIRVGSADMKKQGFAFQSVRIGTPEPPISAGGDLLCRIPQTIELTVPGGRLIQEGVLFGVSSDGGRNWTFIDGSDVDEAKLKLVLPQFVGKIRLPGKVEPVFVPGSLP